MLIYTFYLQHNQPFLVEEGDQDTEVLSIKVNDFVNNSLVNTFLSKHFLQVSNDFSLGNSCLKTSEIDLFIVSLN